MKLVVLKTFGFSASIVLNLFLNQTWIFKNTTYARREHIIVLACLMQYSVFYL